MNKINKRIKAFQEDVSWLLQIIILMMAFEFKYPTWILVIGCFIVSLQFICAVCREDIARSAEKEKTLRQKN